MKIDLAQIIDTLPCAPDPGRSGRLFFARPGRTLEIGDDGRVEAAEGAKKRAFFADPNDLQRAVKLFLAEDCLRERLFDENVRLPLRAGVLGGAFNPPTRSHGQLARNALPLFDVLLVIPAGNAFLTGYKGLQTGNFDLFDRRRMLTLQFRDDPRALVEPPDRSKTYDTLTRLAELYEEVSLIVGADSVRDFPNWYRHDELVADFPIYVAPRAGERAEGFRSLPDTGAYTNFSSTEVRRRIAAGEDFSDMVDPAVYAYLTARPAPPRA